VRAGVEAAGARLLTFSAEAGRIAERQREQAAFLAMRLNAQLKGEIDALRRAARDGSLTMPHWDRLQRLVSAHRFGANGNADMDPHKSIVRVDEHAARKALICFEPRRSRLPAVVSGGSRSPAPG
jgi:hypothetical protein